MSLTNIIKREKRKRQEGISHVIKKKLKNCNMSISFESNQQNEYCSSSLITKNVPTNNNIDNYIFEDIYENNKEKINSQIKKKEINDTFIYENNIFYENNLNIISQNESRYLNTYEKENRNKNIKKKNCLKNEKSISKLKSSKKKVNEKNGEKNVKKKKNNNNNNNNNHIWEGLLKKDVILLLLQTIKNMGYKKSAKYLELESGIELEQPLVKELHKNVLLGKWKNAIFNLKKLNISKKLMKAIGFLIYEQCFIEYLYNGKYFAALRCLRGKMVKCCFDEDTYNRLHDCTTFFMYLNDKELEKRCKTNFKNSRKILFEKINRLLPEHIILPPRRLAILLHQSLKYQVDNCLFHNNFSELKLVKNLLKIKNKKKYDKLYNCNECKTNKMKCNSKNRKEKKLVSKTLSLCKKKPSNLGKNPSKDNYTKYNSTNDVNDVQIYDTLKDRNILNDENNHDRKNESSLSSNELKRTKIEEADKNLIYVNSTLRNNESIQGNEFNTTINESLKKSTKRKNTLLPYINEQNNLHVSKVNNHEMTDVLNNSTSYHNERKKRNLKYNMNEQIFFTKETPNNENNNTQENSIENHNDSILRTYQFNYNNNSEKNDESNKNIEYTKKTSIQENSKTITYTEGYNKIDEKESCNLLDKQKTETVVVTEKEKKKKKKKKKNKNDSIVSYDNHNMLSFSLLKNHECKKIKLPYYCIKILQGHKDEVWYVSVSANGKYIASSSKDKSIFLWKGTYPFNKVREWNDHIDGVSYIIWSHNSKYLVSGSNDSNIIIWSPKSSKKKLSLNMHSGPITSICWSKDDSVIISSAFDKKIFCTKLSEDLKSFSILYVWSFSTRIQNFVFTSNDKYLIVVASDKNVRVIDYNLKKELYTLPEFDTITSVCASNFYNHILVNIADQRPTVKLWDVKYRYIIQTYRGHKQGRFIVHSSFGGKNENYVISGSEDSLIYIWHKAKGYLLDVINGHASTVSIAIWPISYSKFPYMISASDDHTLMIWNIYPGINKIKDDKKKKKKKFIHPFLKELRKCYSLKNKE
ncbi:WD-repeat protein, putative [Plasmodium gallinaceum]|uniref:WD-repeat protein, putative n=1 Tax=Plasmodium gallinaceum TaxID=5849 RepID=A0A1J1GKW4_PLAGA|nr:WD-repeat protein, putative [Plasmodium gallinaceum]CRG92956.1 WD-repeat protein, putative [Plasmodium gallinaceum]